MKTNKAHFLFALVGWSAIACQPDVEIAETSDEIASPTAQTFPASVGTLQVEAFPAFGTFSPLAPPDLLNCHAVLVSEFWALTSAHCFQNASIIDDYSITLEFGASTRQGTAVYFHPQAWTDNEQLWTTSRNPAWLVDEFDVALVRLSSPIENEPIAKLWHPNPWLTQPIAGKTLTVGGHNGTWGNPATGTQTIVGLTASGNGYFLEATSNPSGGQFGDSGGGAFVTIAGGLAGSYGGICSPQLGGAGDQALVGITQSCVTVNGSCAGANVDLYVPTYTPDVFWWIDGLVGDLDSDGVCDYADNCPAVQNPDQANCNYLAETTAAFQSNGKILGDACDPSPCSMPTPVVQQFVPSGVTGPFYANGWLGSQAFGREIADRIDLVPAKNTDFAGMTNHYTTRFCFCRDANGAAIEDPAICAAAPFYCVQDPLTIYPNVVEVGGGAPPQQGQTYWRDITIDQGIQGQNNGVSIPVPYNSGTKSITWAYTTDYNAWVASGFVPAAVPDAKYGNGTDLAGAFWTMSTTTQGILAHGLTDPESCGFNLGGQPYPTENCSMAHAFEWDVAPDRRGSDITAKKIPTYKPAPWWTYCAVCGDLFDIFGSRYTNPAPFLTLGPSLDATMWTSLGDVTVTDRFSVSLRNAIADPGIMLLGPSEPMSIGLGRFDARAYALSSNGTAVLGAVERTLTGFDYVPVAGGLDRRAVGAEGFASAFSRADGMLFVAGGRSRSGSVVSTVRTFTIGRGWSSVALDRASNAPTNALAAAFSMADRRLWIIDETVSRRGGVSRRLLRIDPESGRTDVHTLSVLQSSGDVYLTTIENGAVLLSQSSETAHDIYRLDVTAFRSGASVDVTGAYRGNGPLAGAPAVDRGAVSFAVQSVDRNGFVDITPAQIEVSSL